MISYADFITLMMIVGFVMFSTSNKDLAKFQALASSLNQALSGPGFLQVGGVGSGGTGVIKGLEPLPQQMLPGVPIPIAPIDQKTGYMPDVPDWPAHLIAPEAVEPPTQMPIEVPPQDAEPVPGGSFDLPTPEPPPRDVLQDLRDAFQATPGSSTGLLAAALEERGLVISLAGSVLFNPGETSLKPGAEAVLDQIAEQLRGVELPIMVEGTGDSVPGAMDQWDLASLRAGSVIRYFVAEKGLPGHLFVAIGHGDTSAETDGRVNIVVLRKR